MSDTNEQVSNDSPAAEKLTASVVICAFTADRLGDIDKALRSLENQTRQPQETILVIDHNQDLLAVCTRMFPQIKVVANQRSKGLSGARNTAVDLTSAQVLVMLDDDAFAEPQWLEQMLLPLERHPDVAIVGGHTVASWDTGRPFWFPAEFDWAVGGTYRGIPAHEHEVRNPFGGNAAFRREVFELVGGFREGVGRQGDNGAGGEETELTIRYRQAQPQARVLYTPAAIIHHRVRAERAKVSYLMRRCTAEGRSKAQVAGHVGDSDATSRERDYASTILVSGATEGIVEAFSTRRPQPAGRSVAIVGGLSAAAWGYGTARIKAMRRNT